MSHSHLLFLKLRGPELWHFYAENRLLAEGKCASPMRWHQVLSGDCSLARPTSPIPAASKTPGISLEPGFLVTWVPLCILLSLLQLSHMKTGPPAMSSKCPQFLAYELLSSRQQVSAIISLLPDVTMNSKSRALGVCSESLLDSSTLPNGRLVLRTQFVS